jgi:hypothetical protein
MQTKSSQSIGQNLTPFFGVTDAVVVAGNANMDTAQPGGQPTLSTSSTGSNQVLYVFAGFFIFLLLLKYASEHEKAGMDPRILGIGVWNFVTVGTLAMFWFVLWKVIVNKYSASWLAPIRTFVNAA